MTPRPLPEEWVLYLVEMDLAGPLWFTSVATPYPQGFVQRTRPIVHDQAVNMAFAGRLAEAYVGAYNQPSYKPLRDLFRETNAYAYPALAVRPVYKKIFMSMGETTHVVYKPQTRAAVPLRVTQIALTTGTRLQTYLIARADSPITQLPNRKLVGRLGQKRYGTFEATLHPLPNPTLDTSGTCNPNHPFNTNITPHTTAQPLILKHRAGDIALTGEAKACIRAPLPRRTVFTHPTIDANRILLEDEGETNTTPQAILALPSFILEHLVEEE